MIHLNDVFFTVQGEGFFVGKRALFVRMPFCNLACSWCDTQFNSFKEWDADQFVEFAKSEHTRFAVITGGEPTMHKHTPVVTALLKNIGFTTAIETNGHFPIPEGIDWVCCSPKRDSYKDRPSYFISEDAYLRACEFKYVVDDGFEFSVLDRHKDDNNGIHPDSQIAMKHWLSPEHTNWERNVKAILDYIKGNPMWRLNLQTHKLIGVP